MKFSELSTDKALDVLCELTPYIDNIIGDQELVSTIGKVVVPDNPVNKYGSFALTIGRVSESVPILLKTHRADVYGILSIMNEKPVDEIASQKILETMRQVRELILDEDFVSFFESFTGPAKSEQSAPSADSPASE